MKLKQIRTKRELSIKQLSEKSGVPIRTIEDIERRGSCKTDTAAKLANALNISLDDLLNGIDYDGKYDGVELSIVLTTLLDYMTADEAKKMIAEINTISDGIHMRAMNQAYRLYEQIMDSEKNGRITWKSVKF